MQRIGMVTVVVDDYDRAVGYYVGVLGFEVVEDTLIDDRKRWVVVAPPGGRGAALLLARASGDEQSARVGDQTGGRVFLFLSTDALAADFARLTEAGVRFLEPVRTEAYGRVAVFEDDFGNRWELIEARS